MSSAHRCRQLRYGVSSYPSSSFRSPLRAATSSLVPASPCLRQYVNRYSGCNSTDTTPAGYWYLRIHRSPRRVSTPERISRSRVSISLSPFNLIPPSEFFRSNLQPLPLCFRFVRPYKVSAVQERYAAYGDCIEIGPVDDLIKGDLTDALNGMYTERMNGA